MLVQNYRYTLCNDSEEPRSHCQFGDVGRGLALHGPFQSDPVWRVPFQCFIHKFKMISQIQAKYFDLHSSKYSTQL